MESTSSRLDASPLDQRTGQKYLDRPYKTFRKLQGYLRGYLEPTLEIPWLDLQESFGDTFTPDYALGRS